MNKRVVTSLVLVVLFLICGIAPYSGGEGTVDSTIGAIVGAGPVSAGNSSSYPVHNLNTSEWFFSIQEAIDAPNTTHGHLIEVDPGNYIENIVVNKSVTIRSSSGDPTSTVIQAANTGNDVVTVTADQVTISGFTMLNATAAGKAGILLVSDHNLIENNIVTGNYNGIVALNEISGGVPATCALNSHSTTAFAGYSEIDTRVAVGNGVVTCLEQLKSPSLRPSRKENSSKYWAAFELDMDLKARYSASTASHNNTICANNVSLNDHIGILVSGSSENIVQDNWLDTNGDTGIYIELGNHNLVRNNTVVSNYGDGISLGDAANTQVSNNTVKYQYCDGISLWGTSSNTTITNNIASFNLGSGIILWAANDNNTIAHNDAQYNYYSGIDVMGTGTRNTIDDNVAMANEGSGISLWDWASDNYLGNNTLFNNYCNGIDLNCLTNNNTITNNTANYNTYSGIGLLDSSNDNIVSQNILLYNRFGFSMNDNACNNTITYNTMINNQHNGIWLLNVCHFNTIAHNTVSNNTYFGIGASCSSNLPISSNVVIGNEQGIGLLFSENITVMDNIANENGIAGIYIWESENNTFSNNSLSSNIFEGFYILESGYNTISNNFISTSYFGISLIEASKNTIANNDAGSCYYSEVWLHSSPDNTIINDSYYIQEDIIYGTSIFISESATPSLQAVPNETNATYNIKVKNLGNVPDEFELLVSSSDDPEILFLDTSSLTLGPHDVFTGITLSVGDSEPGIYRATVEARSLSDPTTVADSVETWTIVRGIVGPEPDVTSIITDSAIINCSQEGSNKSSISGSRIDKSVISDSTITDSTVTNSVITNSIVVDTILPPGVTLTNAKVHAGIISEGFITIEGVIYTIDSDQRLDELLIGSDYSDSDLLGLTGARTLYVTAAESEVDFDISAKDDYSAGSLRVQRATLPPTGVHELTNSIGGYVWANVSENVANSTEWVIITVSYDPNELEGLDESSLTLYYFNERSREWEAMPVGGVNLAGHYVWANISHYSVFSVSGSVTPKRDKRSGGGSASLDSDGDGLSTLQELMMGTDQNNNDTDGDGYDDGIDPFPLDPTQPLPPTPTVTSGPAPTPAVTLAPPTLPPPRASPTPTAPVDEEQGLEFPVPGYEAILALGCFAIVAFIARRRRH